jgi:hypothetical protein
MESFNEEKKSFLDVLSLEGDLNESEDQLQLREGWKGLHHQVACVMLLEECFYRDLCCVEDFTLDFHKEFCERQRGASLENGIMFLYFWRVVRFLKGIFSSKHI